MPILSADQMAALRAELAKPAYAGLSDFERFEALHAPSAVPNPAPRGAAPAPVSEAALLSLLTDPQNASAVKLLQWANLGLLKADVDSGDRAALAGWAVKLALAGLVTSADNMGGHVPAGRVDERAAVLAYLGSTVPDPAWPETVPGPSPGRTLFPGATWVQADGTTVDFVPLPDVAAAGAN